jgi:hypothetical protein
VRISKIERYNEDIDWFGIDQNQHIAHFDAGSYGLIPESVAASREELDYVVNFFCEELQATTTAYNNYDIFTKVKLLNNSIEAKGKFFTTYSEFAAKGLYSYHASYLNKFIGQYCKVCSPQSPIIASSLPTEIFTILEKTSTQMICFDRCNLIPQDLREIGWELPTT